VGGPDPDDPGGCGGDLLEGVGWEGGDEWLRAQFKFYLMCLLRMRLTEEDSKLRDAFGKELISEIGEVITVRILKNF
jgi:hypothetical protein